MRNLGLDLLRIVAVFFVLGRHLHLPDNANFALQVWQQGGWIGVDLFFVLSGFLVSSLLFREYKRNGKIDVKRFLIRRGFKLYPAFWAYLVFVICMRYKFNQLPSTKDILGDVFFLQNYVGCVMAHTWSLAVEEHFYLGIAILFGCWTWLKPQHNFAAIPLMFGVIAFTCLCVRLLNIVLFPEFSFQRYVFGTHIRIDSLFFGVLISYLYHFKNLENNMAWIPSWLLLVLGGVLLSPAFVWPLESNKFITTVGFIFLYVGSGSILIAALRLSDSKYLPLQFLGLLGAASYSIYLWHGPINLWGCSALSKITGLSGFYFYFFAYTIGSCLFGLVMSRVVEFPALQFRDLFFPTATRIEFRNRSSDVTQEFDGAPRQSMHGESRHGVQSSELG